MPQEVHKLFTIIITKLTRVQPNVHFFDEVASSVLPKRCQNLEHAEIVQELLWTGGLQHPRCVGTPAELSSGEKYTHEFIRELALDYPILFDVCRYQNSVQRVQRAVALCRILRKKKKPAVVWSKDEITIDLQPDYVVDLTKLGEWSNFYTPPTPLPLQCPQLPGQESYNCQSPKESNENQHCTPKPSIEVRIFPSAKHTTTSLKPSKTRGCLPANNAHKHVYKIGHSDLTRIEVQCGYPKLSLITRRVIELSGHDPDEHVIKYKNNFVNPTLQSVQKTFDLARHRKRLHPGHGMQIFDEKGVGVIDGGNGKCRTCSHAESATHYACRFEVARSRSP